MCSKAPDAIERFGGRTHAAAVVAETDATLRVLFLDGRVAMTWHRGANDHGDRSLQQ